MQKARRRHRNFRSATRMPRHKVEFLDRDRARAPEASARVAGVPALRIAGLVAKFENRLPALEAIQRAYESGGPRHAAKLAVGDRLEAGLLLKANRVDYGSLLDFAKLRLLESATHARPKRVFQLARSKQAADMLGAKRRIQLHPALFAINRESLQARARASLDSTPEQWTRPFCPRKSNSCRSPPR